MPKYDIAQQVCIKHYGYKKATIKRTELNNKINEYEYTLLIEQEPIEEVIRKESCISPIRKYKIEFL